MSLYANHEDSSSNSNAEMSDDESLVRAMIENAKSSSPRENLEIAAMAQKNFMLIPFDQSSSNEKKDRQFLERIDRRSREIQENERSK